MTNKMNILRRIKGVNQGEFYWKSFPTQITLLRTVEFEGNTYYCFFENTPTLFKTRGVYIMIKKQDKAELAKLKDHPGIAINYSISGSGWVDVKDQIPHITMDFVGESYREVYRGFEVANTEVNDILDLLDFVYTLGGNIHLDPFTEKTRIDAEGQFKLSGNPSDYSINVKEFLTSREKPTLSYGFVLIGEEDGKKRRRSFKYPILNSVGELEQERLTFSVKDTGKNEEWVKEKLNGVLVEGGMLAYKNRVYFTVDTSKLRPIQTIHELPLDLELIKQRETSRLVLRSLNKIKEIVVEKSRFIGLPITEWEEPYRFEDKKGFAVEVVSQYKTDETYAGGTSFKVFLEKSGMKNIGYLESLISGYLEGKVTQTFLEKHIEKSDGVFKLGLLNEALRALFIPIVGNRSLNGIYQKAKKMTKPIQELYNSQKIRLHSFGEVNGKDKKDLLIRYALSRAKLEIPNEGYVSADWGKGSLFIKTNIKI